MLNEKIIEKLESMGFNRWQKGNYDRLYANAGTLGLECTYYKTGNISTAYFGGELISNSQARRYKASKTYIDVKTGEIHSDIPALEEAAQKMFEYASKWGE